MYLPFFFFWPFFLCFQFPLHYASLIDLIFCIYKKTFSYKYNTSRLLNVCCVKSNNNRLRFIESSFRTSMSYLSRLRAILYCSNNSALIVILIHGLPISNGFYRYQMDSFFKDEGHIHISYSTSANQYGYLTCVKYKKLFFSFSRSN